MTQLLTTEHGSQSIACVAAMAANESIDDFIRFIGHDGLKKDHSSQYPDGTVGFTMQEMFCYLFSKHIYCSLCILKPNINHRKNEINLISTYDLDQPYIIKVEQNHYLSHIVYWDGEKVYNPNPNDDRVKLEEYKIKAMFPVWKAFGFGFQDRMEGSRITYE